MDPIDLAQSFMERAAIRPSFQLVTEAFKDGIEQLGFRYFACCSHVDPSRPPPHAVLLHNFPEQWVSVYIERKFHVIDPVLRYAENTFVPFLWSEPKLRSHITLEQQQIFAEAAEFGIDLGYTIPIPRPYRYGSTSASCSLVPDSKSICSRGYFAVQMMAMYMFAAANRDRELCSAEPSEALLSRRERQCLELVALGKSNWAIGQILRISEHTVHRHVESAKQRLGVATRMQAVISALRCGQICVGDIRIDRAAQSHVATENRSE